MRSEHEARNPNRSSSGWQQQKESQVRIPAPRAGGALNFNMNVQPQQGPVEWITRVSAETLRSLISDNEAPRLHKVAQCGPALEAHDQMLTVAGEVSDAD